MQSQKREFLPPLNEPFSKGRLSPVKRNNPKLPPCASLDQIAIRLDEMKDQFNAFLAFSNLIFSNAAITDTAIIEKGKNFICKLLCTVQNFYKISTFTKYISVCH